MSSSMWLASQIAHGATESFLALGPRRVSREWCTACELCGGRSAFKACIRTQICTRRQSTAPPPKWVYDWIKRREPNLSIRVAPRHRTSESSEKSREGQSIGIRLTRQSLLKCPGRVVTGGMGDFGVASDAKVVGEDARAKSRIAVRIPASSFRNRWGTCVRPNSSGYPT